jgi:glycerophosphoryl diester phosphodiesterase
LTKDLKPVIFHDFYVCKDGKHLQVSELTYSQLSAIVINGKETPFYLVKQLVDPKSKQCLVCGPKQDFLSPVKKEKIPYLEDLFMDNEIPSSFNIEIKFPTRDEMEKYLLKIPVPIDRYCRQIIDVVDKYASKAEKLTFSSFHPEVCLWLKKHTNYEVFFLSDAGVTLSQYDARMNSLNEAYNFSKMSRFHGIVANAEGLLKDMDEKLISEIKENGLSLWTYGKENVSPDLVRRQLELGVEGIITDDLPAIQELLKEL